MSEQAVYRNLVCLLFLAAFHDVIYVYYVNPGGFTIDKILFLCSFYYFVKLQKGFVFSRYMPVPDKVILFTFLTCCLMTFFRGILTGIEEHRIQNAFNPYFSLSVIVPFAVFIPFHPKFSFQLLYSVLINFLKVGLCLIPFVFFINRGYILARPFVEASFFLLIFLKFITDKTHRLLIVLGCISYCLIGVYSDSRSFFLRITLQAVFFLFISYGEFFVRRKNIQKFVVLFSILSALSFYAFYNDLFINGEIKLAGKALTNQDTRTFMYNEVFDDLTKNGQLLIGKGTLGRYYSDFFYKQLGIDDIVDTYNRSIVEVGLLSYLLRGGYLLAGLFTLLILKTGLSNLAARCEIIRGFSYILLNHFLLAFIDNIPKFFVYDIIIWIMIGYVIKTKSRPFIRKFVIVEKYPQEVVVR